MRFRKKLITYVVAEDEKKLIVDVTRRCVCVGAHDFFFFCQKIGCV